MCSLNCKNIWLIILICSMNYLVNSQWSKHSWEGRVYYYNAATKQSQWEKPQEFVDIEISSNIGTTSTSENENRVYSRPKRYSKHNSIISNSPSSNVINNTSNTLKKEEFFLNDTVSTSTVNLQESRTLKIESKNSNIFEEQLVQSHTMQEIDDYDNNEQIAALNEVIENLEEQVLYIDEKLDLYKSEKIALEKKLTKSNNQINSLNEKLKNFRVKQSQQQDQIRFTESKLKKREKDISVYESRIQQLEKKLSLHSNSNEKSHSQSLFSSLKKKLFHKADNSHENDDKEYDIDEVNEDNEIDNENRAYKAIHEPVVNVTELTLNNSKLMSDLAFKEKLIDDLYEEIQNLNSECIQSIDSSSCDIKRIQELEMLVKQYENAYISKVDHNVVLLKTQDSFEDLFNMTTLSYENQIKELLEMQERIDIEKKFLFQQKSDLASQVESKVSRIHELEEALESTNEAMTKVMVEANQLKDMIQVKSQIPSPVQRIVNIFKFIFHKIQRIFLK